MTMDSVLRYPPALNRVHGRGGVTMGMYRTGDKRRADHGLVVHEREERVVPRDDPVSVPFVFHVIVVKSGHLDFLLAAVGPRDAYARRGEQ